MNNSPLLVELNQSIDNRESTVKCVLSNAPGNIVDPHNHLFIQMLALLQIAQVELDFIGEHDYEVFTDVIKFAHGNLFISFDKYENTIGYDVFLINEISEDEALSFEQLRSVISDVIIYFDAEKLLLNLFNMIKEHRDDLEVMQTIKTSTFYLNSKPFKCFIDMAIESPIWDESRTKELYLACA